MELSSSPALSTALSIILTIAIIWAWRLLNWLWFRPKYLERRLRQQGLNGNPYRILFGDFKDLVRMIKEVRSRPIDIDDNIIQRVSPLFHQIFKNYGKNSYVWLGPTPMVFVTEPDLVKEILTKINDFPKSNANPIADYMVTGLLRHEGEKWTKHRKMISPAFHLEKLKLMVPAFYESCSEMIDKWEKLVPRYDTSCEVDVWPYLQSLSSDAISRTSFGSNYEEGKIIFELLKELADLTVKALQSPYILGKRYWPTKINRRLREIDREIKASLKAIINKRETAMKAGEAAHDDLLGILMESNFREMQEHGNNKNVGLSVKDVMDECRLFYFAGQETTSVLLVWTLILLSKHRDWQARAREEVLQVFGNRKPDCEGLSRLKIVTMILNEVLRLYPPVLAMSRVVSKEMRLGNLLLPKGVQVSLPAIFIHYDQELWGQDASEFKPERFGEGVSKATKNQVSFFPFSWGPRICIGQNFALIEAKMALALMLRKFSFEISSSYAHAPQSIITVQPQHGAKLMLHKLC